MEKESKVFGLEQGLIDINKYLTTPGECECGADFVYHGLGTYVCESCGAVFKNEYGIVRDFVDKYGTNYSKIEIAEMTGVPKRIIDLFVKDGKFIEVEKQRMCIVCRQPIKSGIYCKRCALVQIEDSMEQHHRKIKSGLKNPDMQGEMHYGKWAQQNEKKKDKQEGNKESRQAGNKNAAKK